MANTIEVVTRNCLNCGEFTYVTVDVEGYYRWQGGEHIQTALPMLTTNERELLLSGTHPDCWDEMFPEEEEEEDWSGYYPEDEYNDFEHEYDEYC